MKVMKKIASLTLALFLVLALAAPALAADVTINPPEGGTVGNEIYTAYKIFDAAIVGEEGNQNVTEPDGTASTFKSVIYTIKSNNSFYDAVSAFFAPEDDGVELVELSTEGSVTTYAVQNTENPDDPFTFSAADFADALMAVQNKGTADFSTTAENPNTLTLTDGYFLIIGSLGSNAILDTFGKENVAIQTKNDLPALTLTVHNSIETEFAVSTSANYGEQLTFQVEITLKDSSSGDMTVTIAKNGNLTYTGSTGEEAYIINVTADEVAEALTKDKKIIKTFNATLNEGVEATDYETTATLTAGVFTTVPSVATVNTRAFELLKTNSDNEQLEGAKFTLWDSESDGNKIELDTNNEEAIVDNTITAGNVTVKGLRAGTYYLQEETAPEGYNKVRERIAVDLTEGNKTADNKITVVNYTGAELPSTGGIGTTIFYIVGGLLVVSAGVVLFVRKRVKVED